MTLILAAELPDWLATLPTVNASLNGLATVLLILGFVLIKKGKRDAHRNVLFDNLETVPHFPEQDQL